jgi:hypothetical protein
MGCRIGHNILGPRALLGSYSNPRHYQHGSIRMILIKKKKKKSWNWRTSLMKSW